MDTSYYAHPAYEAVNQPVAHHRPWQLGVWKRLPWAAILSLMTALLGIAASAVILAESNGKPITDWYFQPAVYLAIVTAASETSIADLHRTWKFGHSFKAAILSGRHINLVAVACVLTSLAPINGPLLQRASKVVVIERVDTVNLQARLASSVPQGYSGVNTGRGSTIALFTPYFSKVVREWNTNASIPLNNTNCEGTCTGKLWGLGLAANCSSYTVPFNLVPDPSLSASEITSSSVFVNGTQAFETDFHWTPAITVDNGTSFGLNVQYKATDQCQGDLQIRNCTLRTAVVDFPVTIDGNRSTVALQSSSDIFSDSVHQLYSLDFEGGIPGASTFGGMSLALNNKYSSSVNIRFSGGIRYEFSSIGTMSAQYAQVPQLNSSVGAYQFASDCRVNFGDPTTEMLAGIRDLMFRVSVGAVNATTAAQLVQGQQTQVVAVYESHYGYLAGALILTAASVIAITVILNGFWNMGRSTSLSPIETAKAFGAPMMASTDGNAKAKDIVAAMGTKRVRYGAISGQSEFGKYEERISVAGSDVTKDMRLVITDDESVIKPRKGWIFVG